MFRLIALLACLAMPAAANEEVVLGLSQNRVAITANFDGSEILVFGAVKRESAIPDGAPLEVIITASGPREPVVVRRKDRRLGIWVNTDSLKIDAAPSFYAVATSAPLGDILSTQEDVKHKISIRSAIDRFAANFVSPESAEFAEAIARIREENGLYSLQESTVDVVDQTLFRTSISMPANLTEGDYITRVFLLRDKEVIASYETQIDVRKVGLERFLFNLSRQRPLVYGLLSLAIAIFAGWGASAFFQVIRRGA